MHAIAHKIYIKYLRGFYFLVALHLILTSCSVKSIPSNGNPQPTVPEISIPKKVETAFSINSTVYDKSTFENLVRQFIQNDTLTVNQIKEAIIEQQLLVNEAKALGYHNDPELKEEVETYRDILAKDYKVDSSLIKSMTEEAYKRLQTEIKVSHLLVYVPANADPETEKIAFEKATNLYLKTQNGDAFENIVEQNSDDTKTSKNQGLMGWFTGLQLLYPLETAAYETEIGKVSPPVRTTYGFHLIKVLDKRPSQGRVQVQHIFKYILPNYSEQQKDSQKKQIDSLYQLLKNGAVFEELCKNNSDDYRNKGNGGELPEFWIGSREESAFEEVAFQLREGEISAPVLTSSGWHILKMKQRKSLPSFNALKDEISRKVTTDSRGEFIEKTSIEKAKKELDYRPNLSIIQYSVDLANEELLARKWKIPFGDSVYETFLFSIDGISTSVKEFFSYVNEEQKYIKIHANATPKTVMQELYNIFENKKIKEASTKNISKVSDEFSAIVQSYENTILIKRILDEKVISKSLTDTLGQRAYYNLHKKKYILPEQALVTEINYSDLEQYAIYKSIIEEGEPYRLRRGIQPIEFIKNSWELSEDVQRRLLGLVVLLKKQPSYLVEIGGHADLNEADNVSIERINQVVNFLKSKGVSITRIREFDYAKTKPVDKFDWQKNQRISFQFFTTDKTDLSKVLATNGKIFQITTKYFSKNELITKSFAKWEIGEYQTTNPNGTTQLLQIEQIIPIRAKTLNEAKAEVIKGFQAELRKKLKTELSTKYTIKQDESLIKSIIEGKLTN